MTTVVWFKRDLRARDHEPLAAAARRGEPVIPLYVVEDGYWQLPDTSERQWTFIRDSLGDLDRQLKQAGNRLIIRKGEVTGVLRQLKTSHNIQRIFCHQETGGQWTYDRDRSVIGWCNENNVEYREWNQFGVVRRLENRDVWDKAWTDLMRRPVQGSPASIPATNLVQMAQPEDMDPAFTVRDPCLDRQAGGSIRGDKLLASFLERRCIGYQYNISSPISAVRACSRLSPHIAYGTVSLREIYQWSKATGTIATPCPARRKA